MELPCQIYDSKHKDSAYSRTSRKRPSKMQRLSAGRLRAGGRFQESNHTGSLPRLGPDIYFMEDNYCM